MIAVLAAAFVFAKISHFNLRRFTVSFSQTETDGRCPITYEARWNIANERFMGCKNLQTVSMTEDVKSIGNYSFANCSELKTVYNISVFHTV